MSNDDGWSKDATRRKWSPALLCQSYSLLLAHSERTVASPGNWQNRALGG